MKELLDHTYISSLVDIEIVLITGFKIQIYRLHQLPYFVIFFFMSMNCNIDVL